MEKSDFKVEDFVWVLDPEEKMDIVVKDGARVRIKTAPCCWGPMITTDYPGGHEVSKPFYVAGAELGDAIAIKVEEIKLFSQATTSGTHITNDSHYLSDPGIDPLCIGCDTINPQTSLIGEGRGAIRCAKCGTVVEPFIFGEGYTMIFDENNKVGITVDENTAAQIRVKAAESIKLPEKSKQIPINIMAMGNNLSVASRISLMVGNIGTLPSIKIPASKNAGDMAHDLIGAKHDFQLQLSDLDQLTDAHMDINEVKEGSVVIAPVKVKGGGVYLGDVHAMQGDGELAGHTTDVAAEVTIVIKVIKNLSIEGPILLPNYMDLPAILRPLDDQEWEIAQKLAQKHNILLEDMVYPLEMVGTGININKATNNALNRLALLTGWTLDQVRNQATINGGVEIGRLRGVVHVGILINKDFATKLGIEALMREQYEKYISPKRLS